MFKVEVLTLDEPRYHASGMMFATWEDAWAYAQRLYVRLITMTGYRIVELEATETRK